MYEIEYKVAVSPNWITSGLTRTEEEIIDDYHRRSDDYNSGRRRAFKVERIPVSFETVTTIKLKK